MTQQHLIAVKKQKKRNQDAMRTLKAGITAKEIAIINQDHLHVVLMFLVVSQKKLVEMNK